MAFWAIAYCSRGRNQAPFRSTINGFRDNGNRSFDPRPSWIFQNISKWPKCHFGQLLIALGVEIELRFALRSTVGEITAIEVSAMAAILDFSEHLKTVKLAF